MFEVHPIAVHVPDAFVKKFESLSMSNNISIPSGGVALTSKDFFTSYLK